jgi:N-formylglutamate amidohydrolase
MKLLKIIIVSIIPTTLLVADLFLILLSHNAFAMDIDNIDKDPENFIFAQQGTLPILLTVPHGGKLPIANISERTKGKLVRDVYTTELASAISDQLYALTGKRPFLVAGLFSRKFIDANRSVTVAIENELAKPIYDAYHASIAKFVAEIKMITGPHLLLDIHGQGADEACIFRGTQNKKTITTLCAHYGEGALSGPKSVLGSLAASSYKIMPSPELVDQKEHASFDGGFTVQKYGSHQEDGIDAMQLEFGWDFRKPESRRRVAGDIDKAIKDFLE